ncbi:hypothetical protein FB451DRAFT_1418305 [Mycena latifolia]|nr:hypothetical protein FB451DRAFT_1418305 [Mycena latifolia]
MASPGPRMRNPGPATSDAENTSDSESPPVISLARRTGHIPAPLFDCDEDLPPSQPESMTTPHQPTGEAAAPRQHHHAAHVMAGTTDTEGYAWIAAEDLLPTDKKFYASGSSLTTHRRHLESDRHMNAYLDIVTKHGLVNKLPAEHQRQLVEQRAIELQQLPFSMTAFTEQLIKVFVTNDLSIHLIESREFRDLLLLLRESLSDKDIPHQTKLTNLIIEAWMRYYHELKATLGAAIGLISFTADIWSRAKTRQVLLHQALLAFRRIRGAHSGQRIARIVYNILDNAEIIKKHFTLDNASNNGLFMLHLELLLEDIDAVIKVMETDDVDPAYSDTDTEPGTESEHSDDGETALRAPR